MPTCCFGLPDATSRIIFEKEVVIKMANKGDQTKGQILEAAKVLFIQKGYAAVSMSDLCAATGLSRGGLYRHYASVEEVFSALLTTDKESWKKELSKAMDAGVPAPQMLGFFFEQVKKEIALNAGRLSLATYEFELCGSEKHHFLVKRYESAVEMMEQLLRYGQERGEFQAFDPRSEAVHLVIYLEGLKMASAAISFTTEMIAGQLDDQLRKLIRKAGVIE